MKPLKDEIYTLAQLRLMTQLDGDKKLVFVNQVEKRVAWLKNEIYKVRLICHPISNSELYELIDEAFVDVVEKGGKNVKSKMF